MPYELSEEFPKNHRRYAKGGTLKHYDVKDTSVKGIIQAAKDLGRDTFIVGFSGGKDSGTALNLMIEEENVDGVLHLRTNTGVKPTEDFVKDVCQSRGLKLYIREPTPFKYIYVAMCLQTGFPSYFLHALYMKNLKYRPMQKFIAEPQFKGKNPCIVSGVRKFESVRRMGNYDAPINSEGEMWFIMPIFYWTNEQVYKYFLDNKLTRSPAYEVAKTSLECGCGSFASKNEFEAIEKLDPNRAEYFKWLKYGILHFGSDKAKQYADWGHQKMNDEATMQSMADILEMDIDEIKNIEKLVCGSECGAGTMRGMTDF